MKENSGQPLLTVVIPCFNEAQTVSDVIGLIPAKIDGIAEIKVLVVDDGSTDDTAGRARSAGAEVLTHASNRGLGKAFRSGIDRSLEMGADIVVNIDGDGQFNPQDIKQLIQPILKKEADFVTASRFKDPALIPEMSLVKRLGNRQIAAVVGFLTGRKFFDVSCGFRAYTKEALLNLNLIGNFTYTQETFLDLALKGFRIQEVPVKVEGSRKYGKSRISSNLFNYALRTVAIILRTFRDYQPLTIFGSLALLCFFVSFVLFSFLVFHFFMTGGFSPHKWAGLTAGFFLGCSLIIFTIGLSADMMYRQRMLNERIFYLLRKQMLEKSDNQNKPN